MLQLLISYYFIQHNMELLCIDLKCSAAIFPGPGSMYFNWACHLLIENKKHLACFRYFCYRCYSYWWSLTSRNVVLFKNDLKIELI